MLVRQHSDCRCPDLLEKPFLFLGLGTSFTRPILPQQTKLSAVVFTAVILHGVVGVAWITFPITTPTEGETEIWRHQDLLLL